jgi:NDP-sugar pyrophosphorylase family protein
MVEVGGRPFLEYMIGHLASQEFRQILLLTGHLGEHVSDHFRDGSEFGVSIRYSRERHPLGTGGAIRAALENLSDDFLLLYGDSILPIDYRPVCAAFLQSSWSALMVTYDNRSGDTDVRNNIATNGSDCVIRYEKEGMEQDLRFVDAGVLCFRREVFAALPADTMISLEQEVFPKLIAARQLGTFHTKQRFYDIGTQARLQEFSIVQLCSSLARHSA